MEPKNTFASASESFENSWKNSSIDNPCFIVRVLANRGLYYFRSTDDFFLLAHLHDGWSSIFRAETSEITVERRWAGLSHIPPWLHSRLFHIFFQGWRPLSSHIHWSISHSARAKCTAFHANTVHQLPLWRNQLGGYFRVVKSKSIIISIERWLRLFQY